MSLIPNLFQIGQKVQKIQEKSFKTLISQNLQLFNSIIWSSLTLNLTHIGQGTQKVRVDINFRP